MEIRVHDRRQKSRAKKRVKRETTTGGTNRVRTQVWDRTAELLKELEICCHHSWGGRNCGRGLVLGFCSNLLVVFTSKTCPILNVIYLILDMSTNIRFIPQTPSRKEFPVMTQKLVTHPAPVTLTQTVAAADSTIPTSHICVLLGNRAAHWGTEWKCH